MILKYFFGNKKLRSLMNLMICPWVNKIKIEETNSTQRAFISKNPLINDVWINYFLTQEEDLSVIYWFEAGPVKWT